MSDRPDGSPEAPLTGQELRVLGALIEKAMTTPDYYPLTLNSLRAACNQSSNRDPVVDFDEYTVQAALDGLRERKLVRLALSRENRTDKFRHVADEAFGLDRPELAVLCVLLLRGPQTPGELRARTERMHRFDSAEALDHALEWLEQRHGLAARQERRPGQKEARWIHLLGPVTGTESEAASAPVSAAGRGSAEPEQLTELEGRVTALEEVVARMARELGVVPSPVVDEDHSPAGPDAGP